MVPVYGATPHGASPVSGYEMPVNAPPDADAPGSLADGALDGRQVLSPKVVAAMEQPRPL